MAVQGRESRVLLRYCNITAAPIDGLETAVEPLPHTQSVVQPLPATTVPAGAMIEHQVQTPDLVNE